MAKKSRAGWKIVHVGSVAQESIKPVPWGSAKKKKIAVFDLTKDALFRRVSEEKIASVQRSFERARRGKSLFGLKDAE
jgi:hypothetical protein